MLIIDSFEKIYSLIDIFSYLKVSDLSLIETHFGLCGKLFINSFVNDILERFWWEKKYNVSSYGLIDEIPEYWLTITNIIDSEIHKIREKDLIDGSNQGTPGSRRQGDQKTKRI